MKTWMNAELVEMNLNATANEQTAEIAVDDYQEGMFLLGKRTSGPATEIIYKPAN